MMMWSNFFMQEEDRRRREAVGRRLAQGQHQLTPEREGKIKLGLLLSAVGSTLAVLAVGTEFWVELNTYKTNGSAICDAAHLGLWKMCTKRLWQADVPAGRDTCGPAELPGEANCTYFKFFTTGENARIFQRTTKKEVNLAAAVIAVLGLAVMALGCLCIIMVLSKGADFLLRVGAVCFGLSEPWLRKRTRILEAAFMFLAELIPTSSSKITNHNLDFDLKKIQAHGQRDR
ncbi:voltage-dependent calcium channel gamma-6 subunit isoform X2 [Mirounga leonina]|uniref:voltage-dependent calcium channel gamma-6 subunit isoform X2 n=1 Tax=Mirounga leonina TaxID=9715 RepID=UPI00156C19AC|nr:voltage-dependent calcium channel gamma-6 subunit isoform X2 [Mirounga leonina]